MYCFGAANTLTDKRFYFHSLIALALTWLPQFNENVVFMFVCRCLFCMRAPYLRKTFNANFICLFATKNYFCFVLIINNFENNRIITYLIRMRIANITTCALTFGVVRFSLQMVLNWGAAGCRRALVI